MKFVYLIAGLPLVLSQTALAQCPTIANPAANAPGPLPSTTAEGFAAIDAAHVAEKLGAGFDPSVSMIETYLPAGYATLNVDQKILALINAERLIRRIPVINGPGDVTVAATRATNDPYIGIITANHSLLIAQNAATWWDLGFVHNDAVDGTFDSRETAPLGPPGLISSGMGEIIAVDHSPESAVWEWMYNDADSNWGHRDNILNCSFNLMGDGVAASLINTGTWGAGAIVVTVDFIATTGNTYAAPILPPPPACPPLPAPAQWTCPTVVAPKITGGATLSADGTTVNLDATVSVDPVFGAANKVQSFLVFQPANWGTASGGVPSLGAAPQGTGAFSCPLVPVPPDPTAADPNAVTSHCTATIPFAGNPVVISATDTFNDLFYQTTTLTQPIQ